MELVAAFLRWKSDAFKLYVRLCGTNFAVLSDKDKSSILGEFDADADHDAGIDGDFKHLNE